jgi:hypothetical protein
VQQYYEQTYELYKAGYYAEVITRSEFALKSYPDNVLVPQFAYLGVLAQGKNSDQKQFRDNLTALVQKYQGTDIASDAQNLINYMDKEHPELKEADEITLSKNHQVSENGPHLFAYVVDRKSNVNQLVFNIINFNLDSFDNLNLKVEIADLNTAQILILVKAFPDKKAVMQYLSFIGTSDAVYKDMPAMSLISLAISEGNYNTLKDDKSIDRYLKFFNENYP